MKIRNICYLACPKPNLFWLGVIFLFCYFNVKVFAQTKDVSQEQENLELSRAYNESGKRLFDAGRFLEAAAEFEKAWSVYPKVEAVFNIAFAYDKGDDFKKAVFWYREYLKVAAKDEKQKIEERVRELEAEIAKIASKTSDKEKEVAIEEKEEKITTEIVTQKPEEKGFNYSLWKWVTAGGAATFLGFGLAFNGLAIGEADEANNLPLYNEGDWKKYRAKYNSAKSDITAAYVFYGLAGAATLASGILWYFDYQEGKQKNFPSINIIPTKEADGAMIFVSF